MSLALQPLSLRAANELVISLHRHHKPVRGHLFAIGAVEDGVLVGAAIVGRPVPRAYQDGFTAEVTRLVTDGTPNACSMLYAACWRAWRAMGGRRMGTYILLSEPGTSLQAAGWRWLYNTKSRPRGWDTPSRRRSSGPQGAKQFWEVGSDPGD